MTLSPVEGAELRWLQALQPLGQAEEELTKLRQVFVNSKPRLSENDAQSLERLQNDKAVLDTYRHHVYQPIAEWEAKTRAELQELKPELKLVL